MDSITSTLDARLPAVWEAPPPMNVGVLLGGRYRVAALLGVGGMGTVVRAQNVEFEEDVAVKLLRPEFLNDRRAVLRFFFEAKIAARVRSANVVKVFDVGIDETFGPYIVMELLRGLDCRRVLSHEGPLPVARASEIAIECCAALAALHLKHALHRDVKPENIFLHREHGTEYVKLLDFGITRTATRDTRPDLVPGTPAYLSPEAISGGAVDSRSDIWSLGVCIFEFVTGVSPFAGIDLRTVFERITTSSTIDPRTLRSDLPAEFAAVVSRCLAHDVRDRFEDAGALAAALAPFAPPRSRATVERIGRAYRATGRPEPGLVPQTPSAFHASWRETIPSMRAAPNATVPTLVPRPRAFLALPQILFGIVVGAGLTWLTLRTWR